MSNSTSNANAKTSILDAAAKLNKNLNYIKKFRLPLSVTQHIDSWLILNDVYIKNPTIASNIKLNSYVFYHFEIYQPSKSLFVN